MPHVAHLLRRRAHSASGIAALITMGACSPGPEPIAGRGAELVAGSPWCVEHRCRAEEPFAVGTTGITNHPFSVPSGERAMVEVQTRDSTLIGAGLLLWSDGHTSGPATQASLVSFARGIVGECAAAAPHVQSQYAVPAASLRESPAVDCGPWQVRAGRLANGFFVSIDDRESVARAAASPTNSGAPDTTALPDSVSAARDSARRDGP